MAELTIAGAKDGTARSAALAVAQREEIEEELVADPCHWVRRACQIADYGPTDTPRDPEASGP